MDYGLLSVFRNALEVYEHLCRPVCKEMGIQQGELTILMFLADNPQKNTAMDVHKNSGMKQSMISIQVEKLVQGGYLERQSVPGDRRKVMLVCTEKAWPIIEAGREVKKEMLRLMGDGIAKEDGEAYERVMTTMGQNLLKCKEKMLRGEL